MDLLIFLVLFIIIVICGVLFLIGAFIADKIRLLFGYKQYEYTKILSVGGVKEKYMWHKTDEEALEYFRHYEIVWEIRPNKRSIKG